MQVFIPTEVAKHATNKYLGVLVAAKYARVLNEFPRDRSAPGEKKLTTRALEELTEGEVSYRVVPRRRRSSYRASILGQPHTLESPVAFASYKSVWLARCLHRQALKSMW